MNSFEDEIPKHQKQSQRKRFGLEWYNELLGKWYKFGWYTTEKARDQALESVLRKEASLRKVSTYFRKLFNGKYRKVER